MLSGSKIIVGVTGSIAAYKAAPLVRLFIKSGAEVRVVMTESAKRFVGELTFSNLSQHAVLTDLWGGTWTEHVHLGTWADLMVIAPASANTLGKMANGICDNALLAVYLSARCPVLVAPAMDADMYAHPSTARNLRQLQADGVELMPVGNGFLASGLEGPGRMAEPEEIYQAAIKMLGPKPLAGKKAMITAGPTREFLDPVRFLSNPSTGKMGYALAREAKRLGAEVTLISGPVSEALVPPVDPIRVVSADEMYAAALIHAPAQDLIIMTAAVGDYKAVETAPEKMKKGDGELNIQLQRTHDILAELGKQKKPGQILVGFALETHDELNHAKGKLERKNLDFIVLNSLRDPGAGFATDTNLITLLNKKGEAKRYPPDTKAGIARLILETILQETGYAQNPS